MNDAVKEFEALLDEYGGARALTREFETKNVVCGYHRHSAMLLVAREDAKAARKKLVALFKKLTKKETAK